MTLESLVLQNFRQFYGNYEINFANSDKNITLIIGENGNGKTGIFRALHFVLFKDKSLSKDIIAARTRQKLYLVNMNLLQENIGNPVNACVTLRFEHENHFYELKRCTTDVMDSHGLISTSIQESSSLIIQSLSSGERKEFTNGRIIDEVIQNIISNDVKDLFFFDGDQIEALSTVNEQSKKEIKQGILKLLNIDVIEFIHETLQNQLKQLRKVIGESKDSGIQELENSIQYLEKEVESKKVSIKSLESFLNDVERSITDESEKLESFKQIEEFVKQKKYIEDNLNTNQALLISQEKQFNQMINNVGAYIILKKQMTIILEYIQSIETNEAYESSLTLELIQQIVEDSICICGTHLKESDVFYKKLIELKDNQQFQSTLEFIRTFKSRLQMILQDVEQQLKDFIAAKNNYDQSVISRDKIQSELRMVQKKIAEASKGSEELEITQSRLHQLRDEKRNADSAIRKNQAELEQLTRSLQSKKNDFIKLSKDNDSLKNKIDVFESISNIQAIFKQVIETYVIKMRELLSHQTEVIFKQIISAKDREMIRNITISDKYEIGAIGWNLNSIFNELASGQKQMLSLAFVTALAKLASQQHQKTSEMPLFMDTPFAKLDLTNRENLIRNMPFLTNQWILLLTNSEYTPYEQKIMKEIGYVGEVYQLIKEEDGKSSIKKLSINEIGYIGGQK
jgi:DNA sulfur modification protein DndD